MALYELITVVVKDSLFERITVLSMLSLLELMSKIVVGLPSEFVVMVVDILSLPSNPLSFIDETVLNEFDGLDDVNESIVGLLLFTVVMVFSLPSSFVTVIVVVTTPGNFLSSIVMVV